MNAMLARIDGALARQREFVGDASHELRSPLAALRAEIDVALAHPGQDHPGQDHPTAVLTRLAAQTETMAKLLDGLLFLARADEHATKLGHAPVDVDELVLSEARRLRATGAEVALSGPDAARVNGSASELTRLLHNLGDNAAAYARSTITLGPVPSPDHHR